MAHISVIIPTLNRYGDLRNTVNDLLKQRFDAFEILIIDQTNPSEKLSVNDSRIKLFTQQESSASQARNKGILEAKGEILIFLDDDVIIENEYFLQEYYNAYRNNYNLPGAVGCVLDKGQSVKMTRHKMSNDPKTGWLFFPQNFGKESMLDVGRSCNLSVSRKFAIQVGGMDENFEKGAFREEADFCLRIKKAFGPFLYLPDASLIHIGNPIGGIRSWNKSQSIRGQHHFNGAMYFLFKHVSIFDIIPHFISMYLYFVHKKLSIKQPHLLFIILGRFMIATVSSIIKIFKGPKYLTNYVTKK